jgi:hypothetical protein
VAAVVEIFSLPGEAVEVEEKVVWDDRTDTSATQPRALPASA